MGKIMKYLDLQRSTLFIIGLIQDQLQLLYSTVQYIIVQYRWCEVVRGGNNTLTM